MSETSPAFLPVAAEPDHPALERRILERWEREGTFERLREANADGPPFSFFDGPITANNSMGVHHAWGRSLKDLFQRYHAGLGEQLRYQNGFDCQGLWVEVEVEKALGLNSKREIEEYGLDRFARACRDRVAEYGELISRQSARLGMWMDWDRSYWTMTDPNISYIWGFLKECQRRGWLYRGHRPMVWCPRCGTSLSQHEMTDSYREVTHPSLHVRFRLTDGDDAANGSEFLLAWTTTPWTLPANVAAAVNPEAQYARVVTDAGHYWVAQDRVAAVFGERAVVDAGRPGQHAGRPAVHRGLRLAAGPGGGRAPGDRLVRRRARRGHRRRPHRAGLRRRGLPARRRARPADADAGRRVGRVRARLRLAARQAHPRGRRADHRPPGPRGLALPRRASCSTATPSAGAAAPS